MKLGYKALETVVRHTKSEMNICALLRGASPYASNEIEEGKLKEAFETTLY